MKHRLRWLGIVICCVCGAGAYGQSPAGGGVDSDKDGLPDAVEEDLGTDKDAAESLQTVASYPAGAKGRPELDVVRADFGNVAEDRWLWAIHFARPYTFDNSMLILYLDADNDAKTGRADYGCEWMLCHHGGTPAVSGFAADGKDAPGKAPRIALVNGVLYICHDCPIKQENGRSVFRFLVLSETRKPHAAVDYSGWQQGTGAGNSSRKRRVVLDDVTSDEGFERTEGLDLIWALQADPANVVFSSPKAELQGLAYYDSEYRWPAVTGPRGSLTVTAPKAGTYFPAVVVYDTAEAETYELRIDGRPVGRFLAGEDDNRQRVHVLSRAVEFKGGEKVTFRVGGAGRHITEDVFLLAQKPPLRGRTFEIRQVEAGLVNREGADQARLTWITTWPTACTVEYGPSPEQMRKVTETEPAANHRLYVGELQKGQRHQYRIVGTKPDGGTVVSEPGAFVAAPPAAAVGAAKCERVELTVENPHDFAMSGVPITSGVPFAKGELSDAVHVRLVDRRSNKPVPVQGRTTGCWPDGSIKWLLVSFAADVAPKQSQTYVLEYGSEVSTATVSTGLTCRQSEGRIDVGTGPLCVMFDAGRSGFPVSIAFDANADGTFGESEVLTREPLVAEVADCAGTIHTTQNAAEGLEIEEAGPVRVVVKSTGHHRSDKGGVLFEYVGRFVFTAGSPLMRVYYTWGNDNTKAEFTSFERISLRIPLGGLSDAGWAVGLGAEKEQSGRGELALRQMRDDTFEISPAAGEGVKTQRADGWIDVSRATVGVGVAVRDFWQLYPKGIGLAANGLRLDIAPDFPEGTYDTCSKLEDVKLYYYLRKGKYTVRLGVRKQHEMMLWPHRGEAGGAVRQWARAFQDPPIAACTPQRYCETGVFGEILPATGRTPEYEKVCETVYRNTVGHRENGHEFGMLNFGDQWGERKVNWANGEYDHHHAALMQFARTADRRWYFIGEKAARHAIDVDTCHHGTHRGGEWIHSMGHTGGYFTAPFEGSGLPSSWPTICHTWTEGFCDWYFLSGDATALENAMVVADHYDGGALNNFDWYNCRTNGWHLLLTMAVYRATNDPFYLNAARIIVDRTLERQTPGGGWHRQMVPGHCHDMPRHRGEANFMLGVLANGLEEYYRQVPDPKVAEAVIGGAKQAVKELWVESASGFRYTSCPNMSGYTANNDMLAELLFFANRLGGEVEFARIGMKAMKAAFADGIGSLAHLRWTPHILFQMDRLERASGQGAGR